MNIAYEGVPRGESVKLLDSKVSFQVKDASFLATLDALLASANIQCNVECRGVKPMKLTLALKDSAAAPLLDALARGGGARLWVFPTKLLLAPEKLLTPDEKKNAKLYGVLLSTNTLPKDSLLGKVVDNVNIVQVANKILYVDLTGTSWNSAFDAIRDEANKTYSFYGLEATPTDDHFTGVLQPNVFSISLQDVNIGEAYGFIAHVNGCELYMKGDSLIICDPSNIPSYYKGQLTPAFTPSSIHFDFGPSSNLDPSAKGS